MCDRDPYGLVVKFYIHQGSLARVDFEREIESIAERRPEEGAYLRGIIDNG